MKNKRRMFYLVLLLLLLPIVLITVGFSALSTSLSIGGVAKFDPVGMIRVMSISSAELSNATDIGSSMDDCSIQNTIEFANKNGYATYNVTIRNLGQVDYSLERVFRNAFSNEEVTYELDGFQIGNVIHAGEEKTFTIKFKYKNGVTTPADNRLTSDLQFVFKPYTDNSSFPTVYSHEGACIFNGPNNYITGNDCDEYWNDTYINTGISLYSEDTYMYDYEIGFTIESYSTSENVNQSVFVNAKYEKQSISWPGLVFRRGDGTTYEITQSINGGNKVAHPLSFNLPAEVKIIRKNHIVYYTINNGPLVLLQDMTNFTSYFDVDTWFGAVLNADTKAIMRQLKGTMSHMYIKVGQYTAQYGTVTFDPMEGTLENNTRTVEYYTPLGELPVPTCDGKTFLGWYREPTFVNKIDENEAIGGDTTYYAKWIESGEARVGDHLYEYLNDAIAELPDNTDVTIEILRDLSTKTIIPQKKRVTLVCSNNVISNSQSSFVIENNGYLRIVGGTFTDNSTAAVLNNQSNGTLILEGTRIIASGSKQGIYNNGGTFTATNSYFSSTSNNRATLHNLNNGNMTIIGGTVTSTAYYAVYNEKGLTTIGILDGNIEQSPVIQGSSYGVYNAQAVKIYDGLIKGKTNAVYNESNISEMEANSTISHSTEVINGATYKTFELVPNE